MFVRNFKILTCLLLVSPFTTIQANAQKNKRPNIVVFMVDAQ